MKEKIKNYLVNGWEEFTYSLRLICGKPTPLKRVIIVLVLSAALSVASVYTLVSSIYYIGKCEGEKEFMELQHIESLKLQQDSITNYELKITNKNNNYEHK